MLEDNKYLINVVGWLNACVQCYDPRYTVEGSLARVRGECGESPQGQGDRIQALCRSLGKSGKYLNSGRASEWRNT